MKIGSYFSTGLIRLAAGALFAAGIGSMPGAQALDYIGVGPRLNFVVAEHIGAGIGGGVHMLFGFRLGNVGELHIYPNIEMWYGHEEYQPAPAPINYERDLHVFELSFNADARYYFPLPPNVPVAPYAGLGFGPVVTIEEWDPGDDDVDVDPAFNMLAGLDLPLGMHKAFFEFKAKVGGGYHLMKITAGISFSLR